MANWMDKLNKVLQNPYAVPVYYIGSTELPLLREAAALCIRGLEAADDADVTRIDGPVPDMGDVIGAAGAISFFGTPRVVELREVSPTTMNDKDAKELAGLFGQLENAVLVVTALYKDKKAATSKKAKLLAEAAEKAGGVALELAKPTRADNLAWVKAQAAELGTAWEPGAAEELLERVGDDRVQLASEIAKLSAVCGYKAIPVRAVQKLCVAAIEADVFELARLICSGQRAGAFAKLQDLQALRHEPIAVAAALSGTFVDMLRVRYGTEAGKPVSQVFSDMGYKGSDWRLKKAKDTAARYTTPALEACIECLAVLDGALKSSALPDKGILLEAAVGELLELGARRR